MLRMLLSLGLLAQEPTIIKPNIAPKTDAPIIKPEPAFAPVKVNFSTNLNNDLTKQILDKNIIEFSQYLSGVWDNSNQVFLEPEINIPTDARHTRIYVSINPIVNSNFANKVFYVEYRENGAKGKILRSRIWTLEPDVSKNAIALIAYEPKADIKLSLLATDEKSLSALTPKDFDRLSGCELYFRKRANVFSGEPSPNKCKTTYSDGRILTMNEQHEISQNIWEVADIGIDEKGVKVFGGKFDAPSILKKANLFTCWASYNNNGVPQIIGNLQINDQGGEDVAQFKDKSIKLRLRNIEWPIGDNRPSLTLYLLENNEDFAPIYAWADFDAKRIALSYNSYQASCTRN